MTVLLLLGAVHRISNGMSKLATVESMMGYNMDTTGSEVLMLHYVRQGHYSNYIPQLST
jgi:hypothetical protein